MRPWAAVLTMPLVASLAYAQTVSVTGVRANPEPLGESAPTRFAFDYQLSATAASTLQIFDDREVLVRTVKNSKSASTGDQRLIWDGRDERGNPVPPEAYRYVILATRSDQTMTVYDLSDRSGGEPVVAKDVQWDPKAKEIRYVLERASRVNIRIGIPNGGPLLATVIDWVPRRGGLQHEKWDGKDASGMLDLSNHPNLRISVDAYSLSDNSLIVGEPNTACAYVPIAERDKVRRVAKPSIPKRMYAHAQQLAESRGDFLVHLVLPKDLKVSPAGLPIIREPTPVRLEMDARDEERALARRFEPVFFVDGVFVFENEVGFIPTTWVLDPAGMNDGEHYITANLRGYEGNFGIATVKVQVMHEHH